MEDHTLLQEFLSRRSQDAFRQLMDRHLPMVYSTACRMVSDSSLAQDVTQTVFATLAQKAGDLRPPQVIGGWLYNTTRNIAMHTIRGEQRRRQREQTAVSMQALGADGPTDQIVEHLEPAMAELDAADRDALVLRFFENRSLRELGSELGITEDAARMRVNRAVDRLRDIFSRRGVGVSSMVLASILAVTTTTAVPVGLNVAITTALFGSAIAAPLTIATMNWINIKTFAAITTAAVLTGAGTYLVQQRQLHELRTNYQELSAQHQGLERDFEAERAAAKAANEQIENARQNSGELLRLRSEVGQLRQQLAESSRAAETAIRNQSAARPAAPRRETYISRDHLTHQGYSTPEAALQSAAWAAIHGAEAQILEGLSPELMTNTTAIAIYRRNQQMIAPAFKGMKLLAKKPISEREVEIKVQYDVGVETGAMQKMFAVTPMMRGDDGWKLGVTKDYSETWEQSGTIEKLGDDQP